MNSLLKWLDSHEQSVHFIVTVCVFYMASLGIAHVLAPSTVEALMASLAAGSLLAFLGFFSLKAGAAATQLIKSVVENAALEQMHETGPVGARAIKETVVDYTSPNVMVVKNASDELKEAVTNLKAVAQTVTEISPVPPVEKKKRAPRSKSVKKEA